MKEIAEVKKQFPKRPKGGWRMAIAFLIIKSRRRGLNEAEREEFFSLVEKWYRHIGDHFGKRWIVSITDTLAENGKPLSLLTSTVLNCHRFAYRLGQKPFPGPFGAPRNSPDCAANMLRRIRAILPPAELYLFESLWMELAKNPKEALGAYYHVHNIPQPKHEPAGTMKRSMIDQYKRIHATQRYGCGPPPEFLTEFERFRVLDYGCGRSRLAEMAFPLFEKVRFDPAIPEFEERPAGLFDFILCTDVLEHIPVDELGPVLLEIAGFMKPEATAVFNIHCGKAKKILPNGENAHCTVNNPRWWATKLAEYFPTVERGSLIGQGVSMFCRLSNPKLNQ